MYTSDVGNLASQDGGQQEWRRKEDMSSEWDGTEHACGAPNGLVAYCSPGVNRHSLRRLLEMEPQSWADWLTQCESSLCDACA